MIRSIGVIGLLLNLWSLITLFSILGLISPDFNSISIGSILFRNISDGSNLLLGLIVFIIGSIMIYKTFGR
ncbi:hypothetical protein C5F49_08900 [Nitrosopumilus oxyclinae]|uniref:DUF378 domain-containing protein n=1 Tax=Nitrosopumilus oxyclinae TaxID=1959104 RepID=A0A7D5M6E1_9ARCH|nr:hypothetical protein C5F49_08900 [Nitrosopumilus oxyclinae]